MLYTQHIFISHQCYIYIRYLKTFICCGWTIVVEGSHASPEKGEGKKEDQRRHPATPPEKRRAIVCTIIALLNFSGGGGRAATLVLFALQFSAGEARERD